ncbi:hypothetical protein [Amycolatopsis sp. NPDC051903]|uniref:hypothetical protein n=1 Tax=Amycolatopsis sp. NPDC051903 TaxID=3363936 RepID=UPI00378A751E
MLATNSAPASTTATTGAPPSSFVAAASPERLSAACPFLDADEVKRALADSDVYESSEEAPTHQDGLVSFSCDYQRPGDPDRVLGSLTVIAPPTEHSVAQALAVSMQSCSDKPKPLTGSAIYCTNDDQQSEDTYITIAKESHGEIRVALLDLTGPPVDGKTDAYAELAEKVAGRL